MATPMMNTPMATPMGTPMAGVAGSTPSSLRHMGVRLAPEVNRILMVRNLPFKATAEQLYEVFGAFGTIRQMRMSNAPETRGTAFVVYDDIFDAKNAVDKLSGYSIQGRHLIVQYYHKEKAMRRMDNLKKQEERERIARKYVTPGRPEDM
eukprot:TRINITY_DN8774_c0_g1_i1.p1 TRINITY_DN8774_c0_g1~~TRINITY_DN8774_c0_g1_i1.p1  ORF type:complete len:162 (+),score=44.20 TRINITY_DN8774_c0_g1_i1:37-486(+)